jgi:hypothetical protein
MQLEVPMYQFHKFSFSGGATYQPDLQEAQQQSTTLMYVILRPISGLQTLSM